MKKIIFLLLLFNIQLVISQNYELGKVTKEELEQSVHPSDSSAAAAILFNKGKTYFEYDKEKGFQLITEVETKIKIYKKEGLDRANKEVAIYIGEKEKEKVEFSKAITYNLVNGTIEKTKLKSEGEFDEVTNKYWAKKKIAMPNVKEGSIIEFKYILRSPFYSTFPDWYFQSSIPVNYSEYITKIPQYFFYNVYRNGWIHPKEVQSSQGKSVILFNKEQIAGTGTGYGAPLKTSYSKDEFSYIESQAKYSLENIPAIKEESYVNNINNYAAKVQHELSKTQFPNSALKAYSVNWTDVVKSIYDSDNFGTELKKENYFEEDIKNILLKSPTPEEKLTAILEFVKTKVKWDEYNGIFCDRGVKKAYSTGVGNVAEINLMLVAMLRFAGLDANPVLVSTRSNGISIFPSRTAFNYVIATVSINGKQFLLDATSKYSTQNTLPLGTLNWLGRIIKKDGSSETVELFAKEISNEMVVMMYKIDGEGVVDGKLRNQYYNYNAYLYRENNNDLSNELYQEKLEKKRKGIEIVDLQITNKNELDKPIIESYSFSTDRFVEIIGDRMYFSPMLFFEQSENPFKLDKRLYPIEFDFPFKDSYNVTLTIPDGYIVESLPSNINLALDKNYGLFRFKISNSLNTLQLACSLEITNAIIPMQDYNALKSFFKEIVTKQSEKVVLKKI